MALFLCLGIAAFGRPAAHIAMIEDEVVRRRQCLSHAEFLDMLGATNLLPGPNSTEMAIRIGYRRGGWKGLMVAGLCFIVPAALIALGIASVIASFLGIDELIVPFGAGIVLIVIRATRRAAGDIAESVFARRWSAFDFPKPQHLPDVFGFVSLPSIAEVGLFLRFALSASCQPRSFAALRTTSRDARSGFVPASLLRL